ncbi:hypothetical protein Nepgr_013570 [Nepenthes gracilis]|uniref:Uncharacterized protein n=1 Tax=Nepenthes gracilis TaxID=150966 RepID=A0AAD3XPA0_NEPGR|nr:hypothetical protein Nepgr_013570 [Nepenthes gracilis]
MRKKATVKVLSLARTSLNAGFFIHNIQTLVQASPGCHVSNPKIASGNEKERARTGLYFVLDHLNSISNKACTSNTKSECPTLSGLAREYNSALRYVVTPPAGASTSATSSKSYSKFGGAAQYQSGAAAVYTTTPRIQRLLNQQLDITTKNTTASSNPGLQQGNHQGIATLAPSNTKINIHYHQTSRWYSKCQKQDILLQQPNLKIGLSSKSNQNLQAGGLDKSFNDSTLPIKELAFVHSFKDHRSGAPNHHRHDNQSPRTKAHAFDEPELEFHRENGTAQPAVQPPPQNYYSTIDNSKDIKKEEVITSQEPMTADRKLNQPQPKQAANPPKATDPRRPQRVKQDRQLRSITITRTSQQCWTTATPQDQTFIILPKQEENGSDQDNETLYKQEWSTK